MAEEPNKSDVELCMLAIEALVILRQKLALGERPPICAIQTVLQHTFNANGMMIRLIAEQNGKVAR